MLNTGSGDSTETLERPDWPVYPVHAYNFRSEATTIGHGLLFDSTEATVKKRVKAYNQNGMRITVFGLVLCHKNGFPHILLLQDSGGSSGLLGGKCKVHENPREALRRKVARFVSMSKKGSHQLDLKANAENIKVGDMLGEFWRPDFNSPVLPYLPQHVVRPKEKIMIYQVMLRENCTFVIPNNFQFTPIPLYDFYKVEQGVTLSALPHLLTRHHLSFMHAP